jgi:hypothetical protein
MGNSTYLNVFLDLLTNPDTVICSITGAYLAAATTVWVKGANLGNLKSAQFDAINGIASKYENKQLVEVIQKITEEDPRLLMPPKRNKLLVYISILAVIFSSTAIFHESALKEYPNLEYYLSVAMAFYFGLIAFGFYVMYNEYMYLVAIYGGRQQFNGSGGKTMRVVSAPNGSN